MENSGFLNFSCLRRRERTLQRALFFAFPGRDCCVPGTARILKGEPNAAGVTAFGKSQIQPDGGEGCSGMATGYPATVKCIYKSQT
jgi:hypothetical protein